MKIVVQFISIIAYDIVYDDVCLLFIFMSSMLLKHVPINEFREGDIFDLAKHTCGTEIKAITYSNMQIHESDEKVDLFVIVDI